MNHRGRPSTGHYNRTAVERALLELDPFLAPYQGVPNPLLYVQELNGKGCFKIEFTHFFRQTSAV